MGLYTNFNTSQYYDDEPKKEEKQVINQKKQKIIKHPNTPKISEKKRKSLYEEAMKIATSESEYNGIDFRDVYRIGQQVMIKNPNGTIRTTKGRIAEIVHKNLMYVWMEDTYKDVNGQWLVDFVTDKDIIIPL